MIDGLVWLVWVLVFVGVEAITLWRRDDAWEPFTDHLRRVLNLKAGWRSLGWWFAAGFIGWLGYHFLIES